MNKDFKILDPNIIHWGKGRSGTCYASIKELESIFGKNEYEESDDGKTIVSWTIEVKRKKLQIYSYKFNPYDYDINERCQYSVSEIDENSLRSLQSVIPDLWLFPDHEVRKIKDEHGWFNDALGKFVNSK